ncbi:uracil-xanthine permease family protein [Vallitaleaceae bacterium 9-2]
MTSNISTNKKLILGLQHVLAMFGSTVLVPFLTGLDPAIALLAAGVGTLLFHLCAQGKVPVFLGSSFAFIGAIAVTLNPDGMDLVALTSPENSAYYLENLANVKGGIIAAGIVYSVIALIIRFIGVDAVKKLFPPIVTGPIIMVIGLNLSPVAINSAFYNNGALDVKFIVISSIVVITMITVSIFFKGFFKLVPILISVIVGYVASIILGVYDFSALQNIEFFSLGDPYFRAKIFTPPNFNVQSIMAIAPIALVVFIEHIGDITTNGAVVGKNFLVDPGVHRTMLGDGVATIFAGFIGGPANTTYSENTGVLAVTKVYDPKILRIAAVFAIVFSMIGHLAALLRTIPGPVMGGVSIILFGMIASVGVRILINANLDFSHSRNLMISAVILVLGIGIGSAGLTIGNITMSGLAIAAVVGVIANKILPEEI